MKLFSLSCQTGTSRRWIFSIGALATIVANISTPVLAEADKPSHSVRLARVDEFDIVPMGHSLYRDLSALQQAGWSTKGTLKAALTRYEMAVDTAKAIVAVTAKRAANDSWADDAPRPALRSLRSMTQALRPELSDMGVDVAGTLRLLNEALQPKLPSVKPADTVTPDPRVAPVNNGVRATPEVNVQLSQRLRLSAALSSLARETADPLGDSALLGVSAANPAVNAQLALGVGNRLTVSAGVSKRDLTSAPLNPSLLAQALGLPDARELSTRGGGLDLRLSPSMTLSSRVESVEAEGAGSGAWKRYSSGVGLSAWENRLTLRANLSRLVPEDVRLLPSTLANLGVGFDVNDRTRLSLLYQQLFSVAAEEPNRYLAGGISISF